MNYQELVAEVSDYTENTFTTANMNTFIRQAEERIYNTVQFPSLRRNVTGTATASNKYLACPTDFLAVYSMAVIDPVTGDYEYLLNKDVNFIRQAYPNPNSTAAPKYYALFGPSSVFPKELVFLLGPTPNVDYAVELHYFFYPESIIKAAIGTLGTIVSGSGYTAGTYFNVPLTGGTGNSATANITIVGGGVTSVTLVDPGCLYTLGDSLTVAPSSVGGTGAGFTVAVNAVINSDGTSWLGDNYSPVLLYGTMLEAYTYMKGEQDILALYEGKYKEALAQAKRLGDGMERQDAYRSGQYRQPVT